MVVVLRRLAVIVLALIVSLAMPLQAQRQTPPKPPPKQPLWKRLARIAGIAATPSTQKGGNEEAVGDIWLADVERNISLRVTRDGGYRSPVFLRGDESLLALKGDDVVQISASGGEPRKLLTVKGIAKLIGASLDDQDAILVLTVSENQRYSIGLLSLTSGQVTMLPYDEASKEDRRMMAHLRGWERVYDSARVYVKDESKGGLAGPVEWTDVYLKQANKETFNVSRCDGVNCGQPSLAHDKRAVAYIKSER